MEGKAIAVRVLPTERERCQDSMLEVARELLERVEAGEVDGIALAWCEGGRPSVPGTDGYLIVYRVPGLLDCDVLMVLRQFEASVMED